jgi:hypothetical protein
MNALSEGIFMKFIATETETSRAHLTHQVFDLKGSKSAEKLKQAQAALRQANPQLGDLAKLPAGTLVIVPDVPGVRTAPLPSLTGPSPDVIAQLELVLAGAKKVLRQAAASQAQESDTSLSLAKNPALVKIVKQMPSLLSRLPEIANAAKAQTKQMADDEAAYLKGLAQLKKDLSSLIS